MSTTQWALDPAHSELQFKVKHLMITNVTGQFDVISGTVEASDESFSDAKVSFTVDANSVNTGSEQRDGHLRSPDFFDVATYPTLTFEAGQYNAQTGKLDGQLTIRDTTHPVSLDAEFSGIGKDPWGNLKAGFSVSGKINRKDWGLNWNAALESGGVLVSEEVRIHAEVQFVKG